MGYQIVPYAEDDDPRDLALAKRALTGDTTAWRTIVEENFPSVFKLCYDLLTDRALAEDATQETFKVVQQKLDQYRGKRPLRNWILTIARNLCIDALRWQKHRMRDVSMDSAVYYADAGPAQEGLEEAWVRRMDLEIALRQLGKNEREAFFLICVVGYNSQQAAELVGVPPSTMRSRLAKAREQLLKLMKGYRDGHEQTEGNAR